MYDFKGRPTVIRTGSRSIAFAYDNNGNVQSVTDPKGNRTNYTYDQVGRTKIIHRSDLTDVRFDYDANGNMAVLTNPSNQNHGYIYNAEDQLLNVGTAAYQYNADEFLSKKTDGVNVYLLYPISAARRKLRKTKSKGRGREW